MNEKEVKEIISRQIEAAKRSATLNGIDLDKHLVQPTKKRYRDCADLGNTIELWLVFQESPEGDGFKIVFDEQSGQFGLATSGKYELDTLIGLHGTFLDTLNAM